jgi:hypothetical protein
MPAYYGQRSQSAGKQGSLEVLTPQLFATRHVVLVNLKHELFLTSKGSHLNNIDVAYLDCECSNISKSNY